MEQLPIPSANIEAFAAKREAAAGLIAQVFANLAEVDGLMQSLGAQGGVLSILGPGLMRCYGRDTLLKDLNGSPDLLTKRMDAELWDVLFKASGLRSFMDAETRQQFKKERDDLNVIPVTQDNIRATFAHMYASRDEMFADGVENLFRKLSWDHKTNSPVAFGQKIIMRLRSALMSRGLDPDQANIVDDLNRALCILTGQPQPDHRQGAFKILGAAMDERDRGEWAGEFFAVRWFKNGMGHFLFKDVELVHKLNKVLAARYPMALANF